MMRLSSGSESFMATDDERQSSERGAVMFLDRDFESRLC